MPLKDSRVLADVWRGAGTRCALPNRGSTRDRCEVIDQRVEAIGEWPQACADAGFQRHFWEKEGPIDAVPSSSTPSTCRLGRGLPD
jgi:hypothetical protein